MKRFIKSILIISVLFVTLTHSLKAHNPDQSYLYFNVYEKTMDGTVEMTIKDINTALGLDLDPSPYFKGRNDEITKEPLPAEWQVHQSRLTEYIKSRIAISSGGQDIPMVFTDMEILKLSEAIYILSNFEMPSVSTIPDDIDIDYNILFDKDDIHRGFTIIAHNWKAGVINNEAMSSLIFSPNNTSQKLLLDEGSVWQGFKALVKLGMWHIYIGIDHIFFLLALILPAVIIRRTREDRLNIQPVKKFSSSLMYILKIVTLFTIAHSITLSLAALGYINLESRIVESLIAISIGLAALHNIYPIVNKGEGLITFIFGLFHGMGFASVLGEKGIEGSFLAVSLFGFNLGVEIGQILIVCAIFPFLFFLRNKPIYSKILIYGSVFLILASIYWFVERFFEVNFLLDDYIGKAVNKVFKVIGLK